jgi:hypothetical protein
MPKRIDIHSVLIMEGGPDPKRRRAPLAAAVHNFPLPDPIVSIRPKLVRCVPAPARHFTGGGRRQTGLH